MLHGSGGQRCPGPRSGLGRGGPGGLRRSGDSTDTMGKVRSRAPVPAAPRTAGSHGRGSASAVATRQGMGEVALAQARTRSLAGALSFLLRHSGLAIKEAADRSRLSPSYVSRILAGERVPAWSSVQVLVRVLGGDPLDLYALWEAAQGLARAPRAPLDEAVERLGAALRGAYLAAGCPSYERVSALTDGVVDASIAGGRYWGA